MSSKTSKKSAEKATVSLSTTAFMRGLERRKLSRDVRVLIEKMALNVSIVGGMLTSGHECRDDDILHINKRLKDTGCMLDSLLPLWSAYLDFPEPAGTVAKEKWWADRERINHDFETLLRDYEIVQSEAGKLNAERRAKKDKEVKGQHNNNESTKQKFFDRLSIKRSSTIRKSTEKCDAATNASDQNASAK